MVGVASRKRRGLESITKSYAESVICATSANLRCIIQARGLISANVAQQHSVIFCDNFRFNEPLGLCVKRR